jgi:His-Xaa-Ser system radical SAM maturase HxsC
LSEEVIDNSGLSILLLCEKNVGEINNFDFKKFNFVVISPEISDEISNLILDSDVKIFRSKEDVSFLKEGDIIELLIDKELARLLILYRVQSRNNLIIATNRCNNKCIMCPQPIFIEGDKDMNLSRTEQIIKLMDKQTEFLTITGGEPTLLKEKLIEVLSLCRKYLPNTKIAILSNGRMFSYVSLVDAMGCVGIKFLEVGIPIHSHDENTHDYITQIPGSFSQTIAGIKNLATSGICVEVRVVIQKGNYMDLEKIADLIIKEIPNINRVSFIGMEMLGSALKNSKDIWVDYQEIGANLKESLLKLLAYGIHVNIYNIPLCKVDEKLRPLCSKSISDYKVRYLPECEICKEKNNCGGIFVSSMHFIKKEKVNPIV